MESDEESVNTLNSSFYKDDEYFSDLDLGDYELDVDVDFTSNHSASNSKKSTKQPKPALATCHRCKKKYKSLLTYKTHVQSHIFQELLVLGPTKEDFEPTIILCMQTVLKEMHSQPVKTGMGPEVGQLLKTLLSPDPFIKENVEQFKVLVAEKIWECIPLPKHGGQSKSTVNSTNGFHSQFVSSIIQLLKMREEMVKTLKGCWDSIPAVEDCFLCVFINKLSIKVEAAFIQSIRTPHLAQVYKESASDKKDDLSDVEIRQTIHYVGGAAVKSVIAKGMRAAKAKSWNNILEVVKKRILVGELVEAPDETLSEWTKSRNRGGLKFIGNDTFVFFLALSEILKTSENDDGSLPHSEVSAKVSTSEVMSLLWDEIIGESLVDTDSELLKSELILSFTNTWGNGIALRRKNELLHVGDAVALRSKLSK